ncbi:uncharacterized protein LOC124174169 [Ischnura elegans]|uniref:uncharacterized protein LOC124174169 n=1 Tax=Ischnura elegans TaxID=197161 RepID=UPI001ED8AD60|nr:uncharacterized protein LOC124174169 [Ischnura elegans]
MTPLALVLMLALAASCCAGASVPEAPAPPPPEAPPDAEDAFSECLRRDSIKCVQVHAFRAMRAFFGQERVRLGAGLELVRESGAGEERSGRGTALELPGEGAEEREAALEAFAVDNAVRFLSERSLRWNPKEGAEALKGFVSTARDVANAISASGIGAKIGDFISQGRGKKILKAVIPILVGIKIKAIIVMILTYLAIAFIAKKAILASLISLVISTVIGIRKLLDRHHSYPSQHVSTSHSVDYGHAAPVHVVSAPYHHSEPAYEGPDHYDHYAAHSSPVASHALAYGGQKPGGLRRRRR